MDVFFAVIASARQQVSYSTTAIIITIIELCLLPFPEELNKNDKRDTRAYYYIHTGVLCVCACVCVVLFVFFGLVLSFVSCFFGGFLAIIPSTHVCEIFIYVGVE